MFSSGLKIMAIAFIIAAITACTSVEPPDTLATQARQTLQHAQSLGASQQAPLELREAYQFLEKAEKAMGNNQHKEALHYFEKVLIHAELAVTRVNLQRSARVARMSEGEVHAITQRTDASSYSFE